MVETWSVVMVRKLRLWLLGSLEKSVRRRLLSGVMVCSATLSVGAIVSNVALGLGQLMTLFSVAIFMCSVGMWAVSRFTEISTDRLGLVSTVLALLLLSGAWFSFAGGDGMAPPLVFWLLCLPLVFESHRHQMAAFGAIVLVTAMLCGAELVDPTLVEPYYKSSLDRRADVAVSRMLTLVCCGVLLLRGKRLYSDTLTRLHLSEIEKLRLIELQARAATQRRTDELAMVRSLSRGFAHDLANLLLVISNNAEMLEEDVAKRALDLPRAEEDLRIIRTSAHSAVRLTRRLLESRDTSGDLPERIELRSFLVEQAQLVSGLAPSVSVELDFGGEVGTVMGHPETLEQIILNLSLNAIQAMSGVGSLTVRLRSEEEHVRLEVQDTGPGIPADVVPRIFEQHFTTRRDDGGTGIGLAIVQEGVLRHQGQISVQSKVGEGACFVVRLPRNSKGGSSDRLA